MPSFAVHALFFAIFASLLQVHAALPGNGTYLIRNVQYGTQNLNLQYSSPLDGTPIIGFNDATGASQWILTTQGENLVTLRNVNGGTYVNARSAEENAQVIGSDTPRLLKIYEFGQNIYQFTLYDDNFALRLPSGQNEANVVLKKNDRTDNQQLWNLLQFQL